MPIVNEKIENHSSYLSHFMNRISSINSICFVTSTKAINVKIVKHIYIQQKSIHSSHVHKMLSVQTTVRRSNFYFVANRVKPWGTSACVTNLSRVSAFKLKVCRTTNCWFLPAATVLAGR